MKLAVELVMHIEDGRWNDRIKFSIFCFQTAGACPGGKENHWPKPVREP
jgi:hypothetical protein